ncbi:MAG: hypothetical protein KDK10_10290 [Maritimibacter sp.]|nr:hypothetical protein [Maritimibacter sp.]
MTALESMPGHTRLYRRGAVYYHRAAVPQDIVETYGKREETFSLRTKDRSEALRRVRIAAVQVDEKFSEHRRELERNRLVDAQPPLDELTPAQIARAKAAYLHYVLDEDEEVRLDGFYDTEDEAEPLADLPRPTFRERQDLGEDMDEVTRANLAQGKRDEFFRSEAEEVLTWDGIELRLAEGSPSWGRLIRALQEASVEAHKVIRERDTGDSVPTPEYPNTAPRARPSNAPLLSEAVHAWEAEKTRGAWSTKVHNDYMTWMAAFIEVAGDHPITEYAKDDARAFKATLLKLPANWRKNRSVKKLPLLEAAEKAHALGLPPMSSANLNKALRRVAGFWNYAEAHYDDIRPSLFKGLQVKEAVAARDQRDPFSPDQLAKLFSSPLYTGCRSERFCAEPGEQSMRGTARFWLPLLGLFTGARLNELCQLTPR